MAIPTNITKEHLIKAIEKVDAEGIPSNGKSQYYDVVYNGKRYPPKVLVSYANLFANGTELDRNSFEGGLGTDAFKLLEREGLIIKEKLEKDTFFDDLRRFINQADTGGLKYTDYSKEYHGLSVSVSFGQGNAARVPWIAFLDKHDSVQNGIYPVYLYYKGKKLLVLAYGISETNKPARDWTISNRKTIEDYFKENGLGKAERYGGSYLFKSYDVTRGLNEEEINEDLRQIVSQYKNEPLANSSAAAKSFDYIEFVRKARESGVKLSGDLGLRFAASLLTKPFVILTGLSGSGKTKLAQAFAKWICEGESQYSIVPVGADWTNREPLLGFPNALKSHDYVKPDNGALEIILQASSAENQTKPFFLILDEMNLSHVERYFADFLSLMESKNKISLHPGQESWNGVPPTVHFPQNLFIIGTVNIDETTYMFSPKVLDRANVIEFRVTEEEMSEYLNDSLPLDLDKLEAHGASMASNFVELAKENHLLADDKEEINKALMAFFKELRKAGAEFGYRSSSEILRFAAIVKKLESDWHAAQIVDAAIMQKLLPKVHGSKRKLESILETLGGLCLQEGEVFSTYTTSKKEINYLDLSKVKYPISLEKILRMNTNLISNGFTSYAEA